MRESQAHERELSTRENSALLSMRESYGSMRESYEHERELSMRKRAISTRES